MPNWTDENGKNTFGMKTCISCRKVFKTLDLIPAHRCINNLVVKEILCCDSDLCESLYVYVKGIELQEFEKKEKQPSKKKKSKSGIVIKIKGFTDIEVSDLVCKAIRSHMDYASLSDKDVKMMFKILASLENK
jgi:hypothetical protein